MKAGDRFGKLTVLSFAFRDHYSHQHWECVCDCGKDTIVQVCGLKSGGTKSCGCWNKEAHTTHGLTKTSEYGVWRDMKKRCYNHKDTNYKHYGGRGVQVCQRWRESFLAFLKDMGLRPEGLTLERKDNDGPYSPDNCKWASWKEQNRNRTNNHILEFNGKKMCLTAWAEKMGLSRNALSNRLTRGWSINRALTEKVK